MDVAVIGGGIGGLYFAWRLCCNTDMKVTVFEMNERVGGRYFTCPMPGGFNAEMGAMRFLPKSHKILNSLIQQLNIETRPFTNPVEGIPNTAKNYYRGMHTDNPSEIFNIKPEDYKYMAIMDQMLDQFEPPADFNWSELLLKDNRPAKDMSVAEYLMSTNNTDVLNFGNPCYVNNNSLLCELGWAYQFASSRKIGEAREGLYLTIKQGMSQLPIVLADLINSSQTSKVKTKHFVKEIEEIGNKFKLTVNSPDGDIIQLADKIIIAVPPKALDVISWKRLSVMQRFFTNIERISAVKVFLTYTEPWWHKAGFNNGSLSTDLPISECIAFGQVAIGRDCATILATFTYKYAYMFAAMNNASEKFQAKLGSIPDHCVPSQKVVDCVHSELKVLLKIPDAPQPVCAAIMHWNENANCHYKPGVDVMKIQWDMLKPFTDCETYILSDGFAPWDKTGWNGAFSEGSLLNAERILVNHFNFHPFCDNIDVLQRVRSRL